MLVPLLKTTMVLPEGTAIPVAPAGGLIVTVSSKLFWIMYCFSIAGTINCLAPSDTPTQTSRKLRAIWALGVFVRVKVTSALAKVTSPEPVMACSMAVPTLVLVVSPQMPSCSPVPISSNFNDEYVLAM